MFTLDIYEDNRGEQRWRVLSSSGKLVADGSDSHRHQKVVVKSVRRLFEDIRNGKFKVKVNGKAADISVLC